jgi:hypothetical protein
MSVAGGGILWEAHETAAIEETVFISRGVFNRANPQQLRSTMPKGQVPWASDDQRLAGGFGSMLDFFTPPPKPPQVGRPAGVPAKKRGRPPAAPVIAAADRLP